MSSDIYRQEALVRHAGSHLDGEPLLMLPGWTRWTYWLLLACLGAGLLFVAVGSVTEYAEGPAVIRADERLRITATDPGVVASVHVAPGHHVEKGDVLVRFRAADEMAQAAFADREFEAALVRLLSNPLDQAARQMLPGLRAQRELMAARLAQREVRAPEPGTVADIRVKTGQSVGSGELVTSIVRDDTRFSAIAFLPGRYGPSMRAGLSMRLELQGFSYAYRDLVIERVEQEVVGPYEVHRILGPEIADGLTLAGPVVIVYGKMSERHFTLQGETFRFYDGMHAAAYVQVRSERIITALVPGLRLLSDYAR